MGPHLQRGHPGSQAGLPADFHRLSVPLQAASLQHRACFVLLTAVFVRQQCRPGSEAGMVQAPRRSGFRASWTTRCSLLLAICQALSPSSQAGPTVLRRGGLQTPCRCIDEGSLRLLLRCISLCQAMAARSLHAHCLWGLLVTQGCGGLHALELAAGGLLAQLAGPAQSMLCPSSGIAQVSQGLRPPLTVRERQRLSMCFCSLQALTKYLEDNAQAAQGLGACTLGLAWQALATTCRPFGPWHSLQQAPRLHGLLLLRVLPLVHLQPHSTSLLLLRLPLAKLLQQLLLSLAAQLRAS